MLTIRLLLDFGLFILIWLVQLVIYPGFKFYSPSNLAVWHKIYTGRIALVVMPLMVGQIGVAGYQVYEQQNAYTFGSFIIIAGLWLLTFLIFVPLHNSITKDPSDKKAIKDLVEKNWWRTVLWTGLFLWTLFLYFGYS